MKGTVGQEVRRTAVLLKPSRLGVWRTNCEPLKQEGRLQTVGFFFPFWSFLSYLQPQSQKEQLLTDEKDEQRGKKLIASFSPKTNYPVPALANEGHLICECKLS